MWEGCGIARRWVDHLMKSSIPSQMHLRYCIEGDNREDAFSLLGQVERDIADLSKTIREPPSWNSLFGRLIAREMF